MIQNWLRLLRVGPVIVGSDGALEIANLILSVIRRAGDPIRTGRNMFEIFGYIFVADESSRLEYSLVIPASFTPEVYPYVTS